MTAIGTALRGFGKVAGSPGLVLWLWIVNVAMALPARASNTSCRISARASGPWRAAHRP